MAIQPIDLQNMYSQIQNVARNEAGNQLSQVASSIQQVTKAEKNLENSTKVQNTSNDNSKADMINSNGRGNSSAGGFKQGNSKQHNNDDENDLPPPKAAPTPYIGSIIDITR